MHTERALYVLALTMALDVTGPNTTIPLPPLK